MATRHAYDSDSSDEDIPSAAPFSVGASGPSVGAGGPSAGPGRSATPPLLLSPRRRAGNVPRRLDEEMDDGSWPGSDPLRGSSVLDSRRGASTLSPTPARGIGLGPSPEEIIAALGPGGPEESTPRPGAGRTGVDPGLALARVRAAWQSERGSPELRIWAGEAVSALEAMIEEQSDILNTLAADDDTTEEEHLRLSLVAVDMERTKWLLKAYLQTRLGKLEQYSTYIQQTPGEMLKLSSAERAYLRGFEGMRLRTLGATVLEHLPDEWAGLNDQVALDAWTTGMVDKPPLDSPVFVRCLRDSETLQLPDGTTAEMKKGSMHLLRYSAIKSLLDRGRVELL